MAEGNFDLPRCLAQVRQRDEDAARKLVAHLYPLVIKIIRAHLPRREAEEDLAQDVFMKMFAKLEQFRGEVSFEHWVSRIVVNTCVDKLRAQRVRPEFRWADLSENEADVLENILQSENQPEPSQGADAKEIISKLLQELSPQDRLVITLLDLEEKSVAEIQQITGWNKAVIKVRAFRARRKMKKRLAELEGKL